LLIKTIVLFVLPSLNLSAHLHARANDVNIEVQSESGTGSTFTVKLPVNKKEEPPKGRGNQHP
jgi:hypothetical protein